MAGFRRAQGDLDRFLVAHLPDENDLGRLAQGRAQAVGVGIKINAQFTLVERGLLVRVHKFHRVFQRDDMDGLGLIDLVEDGGERGGFAGTGRAGDKDQPGLFLGDFLEDFRGLQFLQRRNDDVQLAADDRVIATLRKHIHPETGLVGKGIGGVARTVAQQVFNLPQIITHDVQRHHFGLKRRELFDGRIQLDRLEFTKGFDLGRAVDREENVRNLRLGSQHRGEDLV